MAIISCPRCSTRNVRAGFPVWAWIVAIVFFPFGFLAFLFGRKPTVCRNCGDAFVI